MPTQQTEILIPDEPVKIALIGTGRRATGIYLPIWDSLKPWCQVVAVCDPVAEFADRMGEALGVPVYSDIHQLVKDRPMEAAVVVTPIESHHSISVYLSTHGIHNHIETTWTSMLCQAREMVKVARENNTVIRVAENFLRFPCDRFAQLVRDTEYLGPIKRIYSYGGHTGFHTNSRWVAFARCHPDWVQCIAHAIEHPGFYSFPERYHRTEEMSARFFHFPTDFFVADTGIGHIKGHLGRFPRPGYTEWQGTRGTLVHRAGIDSGWGKERTQKTQLRLCTDAVLAPGQAKAQKFFHGGWADEITDVCYETGPAGNVWSGARAKTPSMDLHYVNPLHKYATKLPKESGLGWHGGLTVMDHMVDFVLAVRGLRESEFTDEDALASQMMEMGARESALQDGRRLALPLEDDLEADALERKRLQETYGVDPLDIEAMLALVYPRP